MYNSYTVILGNPKQNLVRAWAMMQACVCVLIWANYNVFTVCKLHAAMRMCSDLLLAGRV